MNFALSDEQELLRKEARNFLETECPKSLVRQLESSDLGYSPELWRKMADLGWLGLIVPEEYGGVGGSLMDLAVLFEEVGRAALPGPLFSTVVLGALPVLEAGNEEQKRHFLPRVARGEAMLTMALTEPEADYRPGWYRTRAVRRRSRLTLSGTKLFVQNAHIADYLLVVARTGRTGSAAAGVSIIMVARDTPGMGRHPLVTIAGDRQFEATFDRVPASISDILGELHNGWPAVEKTMRQAAAIRCVEMVGVAQKAMEMTSSYAGTRIQFERPIGSFQAVQHRLADMMTDVEGARWLSYQAVWRLSRGLPAEKEVAMAKSWTSDACLRVTSGAQHIHGGVGMDLDYDLHYYFRWAKALELDLGAAPTHRAAAEPAILDYLLAE
ncbi:MAG: acyl-CoA dehydrogenase [Chloroflexi bacterium]|nr:acyl-CoA dehydrogenase [Chloroflexota bacterium]